MQQNSKCWLCCDTDEKWMPQTSIEKYYKTRIDWVGQVFPWEMYKKFKFHYTNKWYIHNPESAIENETLKFLWDFEIQTDRLISARQLDFIIVNKRQNKRENLLIVDFTVPADHRVKLNESENKNKYLDLTRELKKLLNMKVAVIPIVIGAVGTVTKKIDIGTGGLENKRTNGDKPSYSFCPEYWEVSQRHEETCCLSKPSEKPSVNLGWKTLKKLIIIKEICYQSGFGEKTPVKTGAKNSHIVLVVQVMIIVTVMLIVIRALGTITNGLVPELEELEIRGRVETIQTTASLRSALKYKESWRLEETCCHSDSSEKLLTNAGTKNSQIIIIIISTKQRQKDQLYQSKNRLDVTYSRRLHGDRDETIKHMQQISPEKVFDKTQIRRARGSTGNCARNFSSTIRTSGISTIQHLS